MVKLLCSGPSRIAPYDLPYSGSYGEVPYSAGLSGYSDLSDGHATPGSSQDVFTPRSSTKFTQSVKHIFAKFTPQRSIFHWGCGLKI